MVSRRKWVILLGVLLAGGLALAYAYSRGPTYEARASVLVRPVVVDLESSPLRVDQLISLPTERQLMRSAAIAQRAADQIGADNVQRVLDKLTIVIPEGTQILEVSYEDSSPQRAQEGAQAFATAYLDHRGDSATQIVEERRQRVIENIAEVEANIIVANRRLVEAEDDVLETALARAEVDQLSSQLRALQEDLSATTQLQIDPGEIIVPAALPTSPSSQPPWLIATVGALAGGLLALPVAFTRERLDDRIWDEQDLEPLGLPVYGSVALAPRSAKQANRVLVFHNEDFRRFSLSVMSAMASLNGTRVALVAAAPQDHEPEVVVQLAATTARMGHHVLLMGADEENDSVGSYLPVDPHGPGLGDILVDEKSIGEVVQIIDELPQLRVMLEGKHHSEVAPWEAFVGLIQKLPGSTDVLMVNAAPALTSADSLRVCTLMDGVILAAHRGTTLLADLHRARSELTVSGAQVLGVVFVAGRESLARGDYREA